MDTSPQYDYVPMNDPGFNQAYMNPMPPMYPAPQDANIASMRWTPDNLIIELYHILGGYEIKVVDGVVTKFKQKNKKEFINDRGLEMLSAIIQANVNPHVSLTRLEKAEADELVRQTLYDVIETLTVNQEEYGILNMGDMNVVKTTIFTLVYCQIMRTVEGHESKNFRTQTMEQTSTMNTGQQQKGGLWSSLFGKNK